MLIALAVAALLTALMMVGVDTSPLPASPRPRASYAESVAAIDSMRALESPLVMRDGGSLLFVHGGRTPRVILLLHGLTNSPRQFRELAGRFHERGYNVLVPRLPLHGLRAADVAALHALTAEQLRDYGDGSVDLAVGLGDTLLVLGLSAGGTVAAWIAHHRAEPARIVVVAPAIRLARIPNVLAEPALNLMDRVPNVTIRQKADSARPHAYFGVSTRALAETFRFGAAVSAEARTTPPLVHHLTLVTNASDRTVDESAALDLASWWERGGGVAVVRYRFDAALGLPHDVIDVSQRCGRPDVVYPVLVALVERFTPDPAPAASRPCDRAASR
jgi:carboxylesterase